MGESSGAQAGDTDLPANEASSPQAAETPPTAADSTPAAGEADVDESNAPAITSEFAVFVNPETGFMTADVYEASRTILRFSSERGMVSAETDNYDSRWQPEGNDLFVSGQSYYRVRFGRENGEERAYFTETGNSTICRVTVLGDDIGIQLRATAELPPQE